MTRRMILARPDIRGLAGTNIRQQCNRTAQGRARQAQRFDECAG